MHWELIDSVQHRHHKKRNEVFFLRFLQSERLIVPLNQMHRDHQHMDSEILLRTNHLCLQVLADLL